jgi:hypothetical protein
VGLAGLGVLAVLATSCAARNAGPVDFADVDRAYRGADYGRVRETWTRHAKLLRDFGTALEAWAVYKSWDFRQAYIERYGEIYALGNERRASLKEAQRTVATEIYEFHLTAQSTSYDWVEFDQRDSVWRIALVDGAGNELAPLSIERLDLPELYESEFFPARTAFTKSFTVRFARVAEPDAAGARFAGPSTGRIALRILGPLGQVQLVWASR